MPAGPGIVADRIRATAARMTAITLNNLDTPSDLGEDDPSDSTSAMLRGYDDRAIMVGLEGSSSGGLAMTFDGWHGGFVLMTSRLPLLRSAIAD